MKLIINIFTKMTVYSLKFFKINIFIFFILFSFLPNSYAKKIDMLIGINY